MGPILYGKPMQARGEIGVKHIDHVSVPALTEEEVIRARNQILCCNASNEEKKELLEICGFLDYESSYSKIRGGMAPTSRIPGKPGRMISRALFGIRSGEINRVGNI